MLDADVKVIRQIEDGRINDDGSTSKVMRVEFTVQKFGPFVEKFDRATFTAQMRDDKLNAFAREVRVV